MLLCGNSQRSVSCLIRELIHIVGVVANLELLTLWVLERWVERNIVPIVHSLSRFLDLSPRHTEGS